MKKYALILTILWAFVACTKQEESPVVSAVEISPSNDSIEVGKTLQLKAIIKANNNTVLNNKTVLWTSSEPNIAEITNTGLVSSKNIGTVTISAKSDNIIGQTTLKIIPKGVRKIEISPKIDSIQVGNSIQFLAKLFDSDNNSLTRPITWASSVPNIAEINTNGLLTAKNIGSTVITAKSENTSTQFNIYVKSGNPEKISISAAKNTIQVGDTTTLKATITDSFGNIIKNLAVNWRSSDTTVAKISNKGLVMFLKQRSVTITASSGSLSTNINLNGVDNFRANFVHRVGKNFVLNGSLFYFGGNNAELLGHIDENSLNKAYDQTNRLNFTVLRTWAYRNIGSLDGTTVLDLSQERKNIPDFPYYEYYDPANKKIIYNEKDLLMLDRALAKAKEKGIRLIMTLTNNWANFGGMDQYNIWYGIKNHDFFYTDARTKQAYKDWVKLLLNRVNTITGIAYKDDPTVFCWELANEPFFFTDNYPWRSTPMPNSNTLKPEVLTNWIGEMSSYIKSIDSNHMVAIGNVGFMNRGKIDEYSNVGGDDFEASVALPNIDFGTFHLYIDVSGRPYTAEWGVQWIKDHVEATQKVNKPIIMEEFGNSSANKDKIFELWLNEFEKQGGNGWLVWQMGLIRPDGQFFVDNDHVISENSATAELLKRWALKFKQK